MTYVGNQSVNAKGKMFMDNYYQQTHSYNRKLDPTRYGWIEDAVAEKAAAYYTYVVEHN